MHSLQRGIEEGMNFRWYIAVIVEFLSALPPTTEGAGPSLPQQPMLAENFETEINLYCIKNKTTKSTNSDLSKSNL